jgi:hypothetical protein
MAPATQFFVSREGEILGADLAAPCCQLHPNIVSRSTIAVLGSGAVPSSEPSTTMGFPPLEFSSLWIKQSSCLSGVTCLGCIAGSVIRSNPGTIPRHSHWVRFNSYATWWRNDGTGHGLDSNLRDQKLFRAQSGAGRAGALILEHCPYQRAWHSRASGRMTNIEDLISTGQLAYSPSITRKEISMDPVTAGSFQCRVSSDWR